MASRRTEQNAEKVHAILRHEMVTDLVVSLSRPVANASLATS